MGNTEKRYGELLKQWQGKEMHTLADIEVALSNFRILFAYHSNAIENPETSYHDTREIFENGQVSGYTGSLRTLFEIQNQKECFDYLKDKILRKELISADLIRQVHGLLMRGCYDGARFEKGEHPGQFKVNDFIVGDNVGVSAEETPSEIMSLCREINEYGDRNVLASAAYFHLKFESIHPFADGNGRVGRTLMNYLLMIHGYPPAIFYNEDKRTYYMALAVYDKTGEIEGFIEFLKEQTVKTWDMNQSDKKALTDYQI